jgi:hypothetical protein
MPPSADSLHQISGAATLSMTTPSIMTFSIMALSIMILNRTTLSRMIFNINGKST